MAFFLCRLRAPRPSFGQDMTPAEGALMEEHGAYLRSLMERGSAHVFGPVADPAGFWGLLVLEAADEAEAQALTGRDPVIQAAAGFAYDVLPMPAAFVRGAPTQNQTTGTPPAARQHG